MQFRRAAFLSSEGTTHHGHCLVSVCWKVVSFAIEYFTYSSCSARSMSESFHRFSGSALRASNRFACSSKLTENQYFRSTIPERTSILSNSGQLRRNSSCSSGAQKPITHSTFERLYQLRSKSTISPAAGRCSTYRWKYHWVRSRSVGFGSATTRTVRGLVRSVTLLITPPLPADPLPSKMTRTLSP